MARRLGAASVAVAFGALFTLGAAPPDGTHAADPKARADSGSFSLLTYNVAGLPDLVSQSDPVKNIPIIGGLLNLYDVAVVQEDFAYHDQLTSGAKHPYRSPPVVPNEKVGIGDGLNVFSRLRFHGFERVTWRSCYGHFSDGSDCFAPKGFAVATEELAPGVEVDLYDLHMDSGDSAGDIAARADQAEQLLAYLGRHSKDRAVIVAGDTNIGRDVGAVLERFLKRAELEDACTMSGCKKPRLIDRVLYRSSRAVEIRVTDFMVDQRFVRPDGDDLSDHKAVGVVIDWARAGASSSKTPLAQAATRRRTALP